MPWTSELVTLFSFQFPVPSSKTKQRDSSFWFQWMVGCVMFFSFFLLCSWVLRQIRSGRCAKIPDFLALFLLASSQQSPSAREIGFCQPSFHFDPFSRIPVQTLFLLGFPMTLLS